MVKHTIYDSRLWSRQILLMPPPLLVRHTYDTSEYNRRQKKAKLRQAYEYFIGDMHDFIKFHNNRVKNERKALQEKINQIKMIYLLTIKCNIEWSCPLMLEYIYGSDFSKEKYRLALNYKFCDTYRNYQPFLNDPLADKSITPLTIILSQLVGFNCIPSTIFNNKNILIYLKTIPVLHTIESFINNMEYKHFAPEYGYRVWFYEAHCGKVSIHISREILFEILTQICDQLPSQYKENCENIVYVKFMTLTESSVQKTYTPMMRAWFNRLGL